MQLSHKYEVERMDLKGKIMTDKRNAVSKVMKRSCFSSSFIIYLCSTG